MYRILAILWLAAGVAVLIYDNYPGNTPWLLPGLGWSPGWIMLMLSVYNCVRWWGRRMHRANQEAEYRARLARQPPPVRRLPAGQEPPDPNFNFIDEPPA